MMQEMPIDRQPAPRSLMSRLTHWRLAALAVFIGAAALLPLPALATITSVTVAYGPLQLGPTPACPSTLALTATIKGTPGQNFVWLTSESIDGAGQQTMAQAPSTIPANGIFETSISIPVKAKNTTAVVSVTAETQPQLVSTSSTPGTFDGTCGTATPEPTPAPSASPIAAPTNVHPVQSADDCNSLGGGGILAIECGSAVTAGKLQLLWDESHANIDKYDVYRVDGGRHDLVTSVKPGSGVPNPLPKYAVIDKPSGGYDNECFAVTATAGSNTSADSSRHCYADGDAATTETLHLAHSQSVVTWSIPQVTNCSSPIPANNFVSSSNQIYGSGFTTEYPFMNNIGSSQYNGSIGISGTVVGYEASIVGLNYNTSLFSTCAEGELPSAGMSISSTAAISFDLAHVKHHKIYSASLILPSPQVVTFTSQSNSSQKFGHFAVSQGGWCSTELGTANNQWWDAPIGHLIYDQSTHKGVNAFPLGGVDVASFVSHWAGDNDANDYGFILDTPISEGANPIYTEACVNAIGTPTLDLTYF